MRRSQANRIVILSRALARESAGQAVCNVTRSLPATDLLSRAQTVLPTSTGRGARKGRTRYAGSGDSGYRSAWSASPEFFTDPAWSRTVSDG